MSSLLPAIILLSGCATGASDHVYLIRCPALISYAPAVQQQAAAELSAMPPNAVTPQMLADYLTLRDQCRALVQ